MNLKKCFTCNIHKELCAFPKHSNKADGTISYRRDCKLRTSKKHTKRKQEQNKKLRTQGAKTGFKVCVTCEKEKELHEFAFEKGNKTDGRRGTCKKCRSIKRNNLTVEKKVARRRMERERYNNLSPEKKKEYIARKSKANSERFKTNPKALAAKRKYDKTDRAIFNRYRSDSKRRKYRTFKLTFIEFKTIVNSDCFYCGKKNCRGVDRVDSAHGYEIANVVPCCTVCNRIKTDHSILKLYQHLNKMVKHFKLNKKDIQSKFASK